MILVLLFFLALCFFFFYFLFKKKLIYSAIIAVVAIVLFSGLVYLNSTLKNTWCHDPRKANLLSQMPFKLETAQDYYAKANFLYEQGNCDEAIKNYDKAIELDPTISQFYNNRGYTYMQKEEYQKALSDYEKAIQLRPGYPRALLNKGDIYARYLVDKKKAIESYEQIAKQGKYAIKDTSVCGRLLMARYNWYSPQFIAGMFELAKSGGQKCN
jgi:tetratricopeptide (TPR) repeat protein